MTDMHVACCAYDLQVLWRTVPVLSKKDIKKLEEYRTVAGEIAKQENGLYQQYLQTLHSMEH